jgi:hypothetical protein
MVHRVTLQMMQETHRKLAMTKGAQQTNGEATTRMEAVVPKPPEQNMHRNRRVWWKDITGQLESDVERRQMEVGTSSQQPIRKGKQPMA